MTSDQQLLQQFAGKADQNAFAQIVERYAPLVFAAARRRVRDDHLAEDITQAVFLLLARKANTLHDSSTLPGWLIKTTYLASLSALRSEGRRKRREREHAMQRQDDEGYDPTANIQDPADRLPSMIDEVLAKLKLTDRTALVLRYLQGRSVKDIGLHLGISTVAAEKRIQRAVHRLRAMLAERGVEATPSSLGVSLAALSEVQPISEALASTLQAISASPATFAASPGVAGIIKGAAAMALTKVVAATVAIVMTIAALAGGVTWTMLAESSGGAAVATQPAPPPRVKVGVIVSHFSATGPTWTGRPTGVRDIRRFIATLNSPELHIVPIIEPGTADQTPVSDVLAEYFAKQQPIETTNSQAMAELDVVVACSVPNANQELLNNLEAAVRNGTGLLVRQSLGTVTPEHNAQVSALNGLTEGQYGWSGANLVECEVINSHPILGNLVPGDRISLRANGAYGTITGTPLLRVVDPQTVGAVGSKVQRREDWVHHSLFISKLGKGTIVNCAFASYRDVPVQLDAGADPFNVRAVKWLAEQSLNAKMTVEVTTQPTTAPTAQQ